MKISSLIKATKLYYHTIEKLYLDVFVKTENLIADETSWTESCGESERGSPYNFYHTQVIMRSFHFDRAAPAEHFSHRHSGARHRIRANSTVVFYEPFECPA